MATGTNRRPIAGLVGGAIMMTLLNSELVAQNPAAVRSVTCDTARSAVERGSGPEYARG